MADGGGSYPLDGAFMWNIMSLDPQVGAGGAAGAVCVCVLCVLCVNVFHLARECFLARGPMHPRCRRAAPLPLPPPQGIHPATTSGGGSFKDDVISEAIRKHNAAVPR